MKGSKSTRLEQWKAVESRTGRKPAQLKSQPILDTYLMPTWNAYTMISSGVERISLQDILAYCELFGEQLDRWQIEAILNLDQERQKEWQTQLQG
jgi:hypothetical protein